MVVVYDSQQIPCQKLIFGSRDINLSRFYVATQINFSCFLLLGEEKHETQGSKNGTLMQVQSKQETDSNKDKACFVTYSTMYGMDKQPIKMKFGQNEYIRCNKQQGREEKQAVVDWNEQLLENQTICS